MGSTGVFATILQSFFHPDEVASLFKVKKLSKEADVLPTLTKPEQEHMRYCYEALQKVSRSFAIVIQQLEPDLRHAICVFYLVLRGLDTIEDDTSFTRESRIEYLNAMHKHLRDPSWIAQGVKKEDASNPKAVRVTFGDKPDEIHLLNNFHHVVKVFSNDLTSACQDVIEDICKRMGAGMAEMLDKEIATIKEYDLYCHYVAGLVGVGLTGIFKSSGREDSPVLTDELANSMGLFLQKTNIIRDYLEDLNDQRTFWPEEIWAIYTRKKDGSRGKLGDLALPENRERAVKCLNHMIANALTHLPDCMTYMSALKSADVINFCAIPQVMAIATLAECYANHNVFTGVVKIRKGMSCKLIIDTRNMNDVRRWFYVFCNEINARVSDDDMFAKSTREILSKAVEETGDHAYAKDTFHPTLIHCLPMVAVALHVLFILATKK